MKKYLILASAAVIALAACNKEPVETPDIQEEATTVLTFTSARPQLDVDTKTAWDSETSSIVWSTGDRIRVGYTLDDVWMSTSGEADFDSDPKVPAKFFVSNNVAIDAENANIGTFTVPSSYTNKPSGSAVFYGIYPSSCTDTDSNYAPRLTVTIPSSQTPGVNSFDSSADIMIGKTSATTLSGSFPESTLALDWDRVVAHADITFSNLAIDGDTEVSKIILAFNSDAKVAGKIYLDVTDGTVTTTSGSTNQIEIQGDNLALNNGSIEAWAAILPVTFTSVDVTVKTDVATYTRSISGLNLTFKKNARNTLGINMATAVRTINTELIADGNYILAVNSSDKYYAISSAANGSSARRDRSEITTANFDPADYSVGSPYTASNALIWTVTNVTGGVKINLAGDTDSYMQYGSNTLPLGTTGATFEVAEGTTSGTYTFTNSSRLISMNGTYGFGCYSSGSYVTDFYVIPATGTPAITFTETSKAVAADATSVTFTYSTLFVDGEPNVAVTSDEGNAVSSTSISGGTLTVNLNTNDTSSPKTVTLTVSATGASDVVLTITQAGVVAPASAGDNLWSEDFSDVTVNSGGSTAGNSSCAVSNVYGNYVVTYAYSDNGSNKTLVYGQNSAGGTAPELLIGKKASASATVWGIFTASGIPTSNFASMTLSFIANGSITLTSDTEGITVGEISSDGNNRTVVITNDEGSAKFFNLSFENQTTVNVRIDNIVLVAGAPVAGITVTTSAATSTATAAGTTATLNGSLALVNGAANANVTEAGFYYKLTSAGSYTKVTCASAPTSTTSFSYDLTGLTTDAEYTFYAYAIYDSGSEVNGDPLTFTPTQSSGGGSEHVATITFGTNATKINAESVTGTDSENNTWTITTVGTTSFTTNADYYQVGSSSKPATSITFTTTLASSATDIELEAKFGGFSGTAGTVTLKVGDTSIGTGSLNATNDVIVSSTTTGTGTVLTVTLTGISKGVKCYYIKATYTN